MCKESFSQAVTIPTRFITELVTALGVVDKFVVPCGLEGCDAVMAPGPALKAHRETCDHRPLGCRFDGCANWTGVSIDAVIAHTVEQHGRRVAVANSDGSFTLAFAKGKNEKWLLPFPDCLLLCYQDKYGLSMAHQNRSAEWSAPLHITIQTPDADCAMQCTMRVPPLKNKRGEAKVMLPLQLVGSEQEAISVHLARVNGKRPRDADAARVEII
jgi:hypothetical protein